MPTCPNGHQSGSDDWCEVCGHRMAGAVPPPPPPTAGGYGFPPPAPGAPAGAPMGGGRHLSAVPNGAEPELCPQCRTPREGGAPFCEECRWNFLTNTATSYTPAAPRPPAGGGPAAPTFRPPAPPSFGGGDSYEYQGSRPSQMNRPAEPIPSFGSEPSGPTPFAGERGGGQSAFGGGDRGRPGQPGQPGPPGFGGGERSQQSGPPAFGGGDRGQQSGPPAFGGDRGQSAPAPFGGERGPSAPPPPPPYGGAPGQNAGGASAFGAPPGAGQASGPYTRDPSGGPAAGPFGGSDPSRPPAGPGPTSGGAPGAFQQSAPTAPPAFPQETRPPAGPSFGGRDDDWVISPPGQAAGPGAPARPGGYGYPQPGSTQAPPGPAFPQAPQAPATWTATIGPDREYFMAMMQRSGPEAAGLNLPAYSPEQQRTLTGNQVTIGRRRHSTGDTPDIDLSVPPEDPGVSHQHAVLVQQPDGSWAVVDQNSTNGTTVNGGEEPIQPFVPVPLQDGDRVHVGAWTTITVRRG
ncbi:FHA domain-containing protein [Streptomyces shenzhenensis]|uniref:FHA domain-containing protein n=1 Tax=Streptomyces shenzhenensis TaxID=943815 RepID=UPI001F234AB4|nr:FHA domain-containing protein [Streptomyces shenzhenensis]